MPTARDKCKKITSTYVMEKYLNRCPRTGCLLTFNLGCIPHDYELSTTQIYGWKAFDKFTILVHMGGFGSVATMANQAIDMSDPRTYIPEK